MHQSVIALSLVPFAQAAFLHPGLLHTAADLERIIPKVESLTEPWISGWYKLTNNSYSSADYAPSPQAEIFRGDDGEHTENYPSLYRDIAAGYNLALQWKITGDTRYADAAVAILDGWSSTLTLLGGSTDVDLAAGIYGYEFANVAELMRDYSGWSSSGLSAFIDMMATVFYPISHDFLIRHNDAAIDHYWANWDLCNIAAIMSLGVLSDNETMYQEGLDYFKNGEGNGQINNMIWQLYEDVEGQTLGQGQEAGRDQGHALLDFALLGPIALTAYNQGEDLFEYQDNFLLAGAEYVAKYNMGEDVPYTTYTNSDVTQDVISESGRGGIRPIWELLYNHYGVLKGLDVTWTQQMRDLVVEDGSGAEGGGSDYGSTSGAFDQLGHGTLMYTL